MRPSAWARPSSKPEAAASRAATVQFTADEGGQIIPDSKEEIDSCHDPEVEFLELGVRAYDLDSTNEWRKVYGPDLDGAYGGLQGIGGLEAVIDQDSGGAVGVVNDSFGTCVAWITSPGGTPTWNACRVTGYGPAADSFQKPFSTGISLAEATVWRSRRVDPTGFFWLGARYYEPHGGRFLSPDPLGHGASWSLYDYAAGDPVNGMDPDGRLASPMRSMAEMTRTAAGALQSYADRSDNAWLGVPAAIAAHNLQQASDLLTPSSHVNNLTSAYDANGGGLVGVAAMANVYNPGRPVYNAFTGRELVYGYQLSGEERLQAGLTSLSLAGGVGSIAVAESSVALSELELAASIRGTSLAPKPPVLATAPRTTTGAESAFQYQQLKASLRLQESLGNGKLITNQALDVGHTRVAVFDQATGKMYLGREGIGGHIDVVHEFGLTVGDNLVGGVANVAPNGQVQFLPASGSFPLPSNNGAGVLDQIRGTGVSIIGGR